MKIGDYVVRKKYNKDIIFEIFDKKDDIYYLRGVELRLIADSQLEDLELSEIQSNIQDEFSITRQPMIRGKVLHLDGDEKYLNMCQKKYQELRIRADCYFMNEKEMKDRVLELLEKHKPQILVITGHDALRKDHDKSDILNYQHSLDFVETIKSARSYEDDKDALIIIAGACQSYYEMLLASGANFASSPKRINIHALDPVYIASLIANESVRNYCDVEDIINQTSHKQSGIGGIDTKGVARKIYPTKG
ncbi:MAG: sporulation peptidase YabG [Coprobacillus sp.]